VSLDDDGHLVVTITPTYSGCPAMDAIRDDLLAAFARAGRHDVRVELVLSPAWTTDWITPSGREKLAASGIAPPRPATGPIPLTLTTRCPRCGSPDTEQLSRFGSTACKALRACNRCREPFDHFKRI
jgi:ring-1,2-phenylacetyl-CoA epoxidase subunit PaaD